MFGFSGLGSSLVVGIAALVLLVTWPLAGALVARTVPVNKGVPGGVFLALGWLALIFYVLAVWPALGIAEISGWVADSVSWRWRKILLWYRVALARIAPEYFARTDEERVRAFGGFAWTHGGRGFVLVAAG